MDRNELTVAIAGALLAAMLLGWCLRWIYGRINTPSGPRSIKATAQMAARLHAAEEAQLAAETRLREVESDLTQRLDEMQAELSAAHANLARARNQTEEVRAAYRDAMARGARDLG